MNIKQFLYQQEIFRFIIKKEFTSNVDNQQETKLLTRGSEKERLMKKKPTQFMDKIIKKKKEKTNLVTQFS